MVWTVVQRLAGLCHTEGPGDEAVRTDCFFIFLFFCFLQFVVSAFTSTQDLDSVHVVNKEEQQTRVYTVLYCHVITKKQNKTKQQNPNWFVVLKCHFDLSPKETKKTRRNAKIFSFHIVV